MLFDWLTQAYLGQLNDTVWSLLDSANPALGVSVAYLGGEGTGMSVYSYYACTPQYPMRRRSLNDHRHVLHQGSFTAPGRTAALAHTNCLIQGSGLDGPTFLGENPVGSYYFQWNSTHACPKK